MMEIKFKQVPRSSIKSNEKVPTMLIQERVTQVRKSVYRTMASHTIYSNINNKWIEYILCKYGTNLLIPIS